MTLIEQQLRRERVQVNNELSQLLSQGGNTHPNWKRLMDRYEELNRLLSDVGDDY